MSDEAVRSALFGGARPSPGPNPYADADSGHAAAAGSPASLPTPALRPDEAEDEARAVLLGSTRRAVSQSTPVVAAVQGEAGGEGDGQFTFGADLEPAQDDLDFDTMDDDLARFQQDPVVREALSKNVDLRQYARQIDEELRQVEKESVRDYVQEGDNMARLLQEITECDGILGDMQRFLLAFQGELGGISDEIRHLQDQSLSMSVKLRNRKQLEGELHELLQQVVVPEPLVQHICQSTVNDAYLEYLTQLNAKLQLLRPAPAPSPASDAAADAASAHAAVTAADAAGAEDDGRDRSASAVDGGSADAASARAAAAARVPVGQRVYAGVLVQQSLAARESTPLLEKLRIKAVGKARAFLVQEFNKLKSAKTNVQMNRENFLLRFKYFLEEHAPEVAAEVRQVYVDMMSKLMHSVFRSYHAQLNKLRIPIASNKNDVVAVEERALRSQLSSKVDLSKQYDSFALGQRAELLQQPDADVIMAHVAQERRYPFEALFRSLQLHLMNTATAEYLFLQDFFGRRSGDMFGRVFARVLSLILEQLENFLISSYDAIGLLIMIRLTHAHRSIMEARRLSCLDAYFDRVSMLLWPRFKAVMDLNLQSVMEADPRKLGAVDMHAHYVTRRYAELASSVLALHASLSAVGMADMMVMHNLRMLRDGIEQLLLKLSERLPHRKERIIFLINNYSQILTLFEERRVPEPEVEHVRQAQAEQVALYVEEELHESYGRLIQFVKATEAAAAAAGGAAQPAVDAGEVEGLVRQFADTWKAGIERVHANVMRYFSHYRNGMEILKQVLTQLLLYYTRFQNIIKQAFSRPPPWVKELVSVPIIMFEIRKYSHTIE